jgi:hypothetical protein
MAKIKRTKTDQIAFSKDVGKKKMKLFHMLLVGMRNGTTTLKKSVIFLKKVLKHTSTILI